MHTGGQPHTLLTQVRLEPPVIGGVTSRVQDLQLRDRAGRQHPSHGNGLERAPRVRVAPGQLMGRLVQKEKHDGGSGRTPRAGPVILVRVQLGN
jgi:hypothetical protein